MAKNFKKALSAFLALLMCVSTFAPAVMAEEATQTTWLGDDVDLTFQAGKDPYVYAIAQDAANNRWYYETSNHTVLKEVTGGGAVHIFPIVDTTKVTGKWDPTGIYENGVSNYDVMYCCDATTGTDGEIYYKRVNLEDSEYVSNTDAKRLRAIVENAYPYVSVEEAKAALKEAGFAQADELDRSELIAATQAAIWTIANPDSGDSYRYNKTATTAQKLTWGGYMHEFASEITNFTDSTTSRKYLSNPNGVGDRVNALINFYLAMEGVDAEAGQIVITKLDINSSKIAGSDDTYNVTLDVALNHGADDNDDVQLNVYVNGELVESKSVAIDEGTEYTVNLVAKAKDKIKVEVTGMQNLERGVYFYAPKPQDIDGDGIATSREVSQNLIGVGSGETPVHAERNFTVDIVNVDLEINKIDGNGNSLSGAKFAIYDKESGQLVDTKTVDENGTLVFEGLIPGEYTLKETVAPFGYILPEEANVVVIGEDGSVFFNGVKLEGEKETTDPVVIEGEAVKSPEVTVGLVPGDDTENTETSVEVENAVKTVVAVRKVTAEMTAVEVTSNTTSSEVEFIQPALKFDRNDTADQKDKKVTTELYTDNGHFHDPTTFTVTDAPAGYPFKYVGHGDYSGHYISHVKVVYKRDAAGNALKDANGNYVIDHLEHASSGTPLHYGTELVTNPEGPFHYATGTRAQQFLLMTEEGKTVYAYCIDLSTGAESETWYAIANLEDNDYYASEEAENHIRNIIMNGYWGTESGTGSLASLKEALKAAIKNPESYGIDVEQDVTLVNRKKFTTGYELQEGEYHNGSYVYWSLPTVKVVLNDDIIDQLTEGEALDAMQAAIWSWANGSNATLNGVDRAIIGDLYAASSSMSDSLNGKNDPEGAARTKALYQYLMSLDEPIEASVVINDKTFAENMSLTVGNKIGDGIYKASLSFSLPVELGEQDNLTVVLTYVDAYGETQTIKKPLTGEGALEARSGIYTIDGLALRGGEEFNFSLNIYGGQYLEKSAYILTAQNGTSSSQTFVTLAEGMNTVNVTKSASIVFEVDDYAEVTYNRYKYSVVIENEPEELEGDKTSTGIFDNRFEISIEVPGGDAEVKHDEVILMVDGSYSMDNEWPAMKEAITTIGEAVLDGSGHTQLTLMAFGMGDNEVLVHVKTVEELAAALGELPGTLLYGRSSTNCEAGFTGVAEYIANHDETLGKVDVIFISDGNLNTDETPRAFDANWQTWTKFGALGVAQEAFGGTVSNGANLPAAFTTVFGNRFDGATREEIISRAFGGEVTDEEFIAFAEQLWTDVYAYSGLTRGVAYPVSDAERAFVKYDKENGTYIQDLFYYATYKSAYVTYGDRWTRTPAAANELAAMDEVKALYVVDYDGYTPWMDTGITSEKSTFVQSNGIVGLIEALKETLSELALTPYNDVVITDYMSKWVNLDPSTLKIVDNTTGEIIWTAAEGWLIAEELRPTAQDVPVVVELVDRADYDVDDEAVYGNTSGDIYLLTWYVKDGALLRSDNYKLVYEVEVDTAEYGFKYGVDYPANGFTDLHYIDVNGDDQTNKIKVPNIISITGTVTLKKVDENGKLISGAVFELYKIENGTEARIGTYKLDNGKIAINDLAVGSYKLVETKAPKGYIGIDEPMYFEIIRNKSGKLEVKIAYELEFPATAYEISNHITSVAIPQTFVILDAENAKNWTYSGEFVFGESNYDVVYCADSETGVVDGTKYYRVDLADIFGEEAAAKLRAIVANSYPYVSVADMIAAAAAANVADAENLTRGDIIAAVQLAIWHQTNGIKEYTYKATYSVEAYPRWGKVFHDYSNEIGESLPNDNNTAKIVDEASEARIRALYNYLLDLESDTECDTDVFVYVPQGGKDVSQMLIGGTRTNFYTNGMEISVVNVAEKVTVPPTITFKKGEASNISFMLIDKETGAVEFLKKIDIGNQTSFEIPTEEGKISAVFVKQSTSGMFWFAEEVDEATQQAVINCLKKNNPSYKGYNALCFGAGDHDLEFKKNKFVTYTFTGEVVDTVETPETEAPETEAPEAEAPETEAPETEAPETEAPEVEEPVTPPVVEEPAVKTLNYEVKGAKITSWTVVDGITAIYIKGNGKVPSVLWTSEKAKGMTLINILVELDLLDNMPEYQFDTVGAHTFHYQQNKKKTVSVTYTFIEK